MRATTISVRSALRASALAALATLLFVAPAAAYGPKAHLASANHTVDELNAQNAAVTKILTFDNGTGSPISMSISVNRAIVAARDHQDFFRAGVLGPDAFPDIVTGQLFAHGNSFPDVMKNIRRAAGISPNTGIEIFAGSEYDAPLDARHGIAEYRPIDFAMMMLAQWSAEFGAQPEGQWSEEGQQALAFIVGYIGHGVGDGFSHTWLNEHAHGAWSLLAGDGSLGPLTEEIRHLAIENALDLRVPDSALSSAGSPTDMARSNIRVPFAFLDRFFASQVKTPYPLGNATSTSPADFVDHFRHFDRYHGGAPYAYFDAQVRLVDALGRWSRLKPLFDLNINPNVISTIDGFASLIQLPAKVASQIHGLADPLSKLISDRLGFCGIHPWLSSPAELDNSLHDIALILGFPDRLQRQTRRAIAARKNWLLLNECTTRNIARIKSGPNALSPTDACAAVVRAGWGPQGLQDEGLLSSPRPEDIEFRQKVEDAFRGIEDGLTLEERNGHQSVGENLDRLYTYLLKAGFTAPSLSDAVFPEDLSRDWRNKLGEFCGAIKKSATPGSNCLIAQAAEAVVTTYRLGECQVKHGECLIDTHEKCVLDKCHEHCPVGFDCSDICGEPSKCVKKCNKFQKCIKIFGKRFCIPFGPLGPGDPSLLHACRGTCSVFVGSVNSCTAASFETVPCGIESVICSGEQIADAIRNDVGDAILKPLEQICDGLISFVDTVDCLEQGDAHAQPEEIWDGRLRCATDLCAQTLSNPLTGGIHGFSEANAICQREIQAITEALDDAKGTAESVSAMYDQLHQNPVQFLNISYLVEDVQSDPLYAIAVGLPLVSAMINAYPALPPDQRCVIDGHLRELCAASGLDFLCPSIPPGCTAQPVTGSWLFRKLASGVPTDLNDIRAETRDAQVVLQFLLANGVIPGAPGPTARTILSEIGDHAVPATFDPMFNTVQGMKLATMIDRTSVDQLLARAGITSAQRTAAYSQICSEAGFASPYCDVLMSLDDPNCIGENAPLERCDPTLRETVAGLPARSVGRGIFAFNDNAAPNEVTRFAPASNATVNTSTYDKIFRGDKIGTAFSMVRGGPARTGFFPVEGPTSASDITEFSPLAFGWSTAVASLDDELFFGSATGDLYAVKYDSVSGDLMEKWKRDINTVQQPSGGQVVREHGNNGTYQDFIYVGGERFPLVGNALLKLRVTNGSTVWSYAPSGLGEILGAPLVDQARNQVYFATASNRLYAVRASDGGALWNIPLAQGLFGAFGSVEGAIAQGPDGMLYVASTDGGLTAVDPTPGLAVSARKRWVAPLGGGAVGTPAVGRGQPYLIYIGTDANELVAVRSTGQIAWRAPAQVPWFIFGEVRASAAIGPDGTVYFSGEDELLHAVNGATGVELWDYPVNGTIEAAPIVDRDGTIYVATTEGWIYSLRPGASLTDAARPYFAYDLGFQVIDSLSMTQHGDLLVTARGIPSLFAIRR